MIVALDATPLIVPTGGVRRYVEELSRALAVEFPKNRFDLVSDQLRRPDRWLSRRWWLLGVQQEMRKLNSDVFHGTDFSVPYLPMRPSVMTLHDLSPWRFPGSPRVRRRAPFLLRFGIATMVITPSEAVRKEAIAEFGLAPERVAAIPLAASAFMEPLAVAPAQSNPYFLCVSTIEPRKNIQTLIDAWREVRKQFRVDLVLAGRLREGEKPPPVEPGLRFLGGVCDRELPTLYSAAVASFYPSLYEGFGLPVLEAMQCGAAVVTSRDPAVMETGGDAAITVEATDVRGWIEAMRGLLENPQQISERRAASLKRAAQFTWARTARETLKVYESAIDHFEGP
jgi:glycosyltransferase involved in cell wall biosynthesis